MSSVMFLWDEQKVRLLFSCLELYIQKYIFITVTQSQFSVFILMQYLVFS